jgi:excisionase family DNA binding protein
MRSWYLAHGWLSPVEAARLLGVTAERVRRLGEQGRLRVGRDEQGHRWFDRADLERRATAMRALHDVRAQFADVLRLQSVRAGAVR